MYSQNYARRRAMWSSSSGRYIQTSLGSRASLDSDEEDTSSVSGISTQSTKSYKSWRRAVRQRRQNLKRAMTLDGPAMEALDLSGDWGKAAVKAKTLNANTSKGEEAAPSHVSDVDNVAVLPKLDQLPYYSSSPLTSSSCEQDEPSSPGRSPSEIGDNEDQSNLERLREQHSKNKDPLTRRSYPFILPRPQSEASVEPSSPRNLTTPQVNYPIIERTSIGETKGLNEILNLEKSEDKPPSLLELSKQKSIEHSIEDTTYTPPSPTDPEIVYAETNGFTVTLPTTSPTVPAHVLGEESSQTESQSIENERMEEIMMNEENNKREQWRREKKTSPVRTDSDAEAEKIVQHQIALRTDPGIYFLPPLIAKAIKNKEINEIKESIKHHGTSEKASLKDHRNSYGSTTEEDVDNAYLENADEIIDDLEEDDFLKPAIRARQESDTSSLAAAESVDPIENILIRENSTPVDEETFTVNGRTVVKVGKKEPVQEEDIQVEAVVTEEAAPDIQELPSPYEVKVEEQVTEEIIEPTLKRVHSHRVGKDKNCPFCKKKDEEAAKMEKPEVPQIIVEEETIESQKITEQEALPVPVETISRLVHSHKVLDDSKCEVCNPKGPPAKDFVPELCCIIL